MADASGSAARETSLPRLLIVDDDGNLRKLLAATFSYGKYEIHEACNGVDAVRLASRLEPAVILLDVMMPGELDGLEACRRIKAQPALKGTVVVLLTALGQENDRQRGELAGADAYIVKPFSPLKLIELVDSLP